jgi:hypothetical protein
VVNVFQLVPHASKNGSGVFQAMQHHRLDDSGRHWQSGQRIPRNLASSSASSATGVRTGMCMTR